MQIAQHKVVTIDYTLTDEEGRVLDQSNRGEFAYIHGTENLIPGLEKQLEGKQAGEELKVTVPPEEAYGERDERLLQSVGRDMFPEDAEVAVGAQFHAQTPNGQPLVVTITEVQDENVTVDANHPLAGQTLNFDVKVVDVRDASEDEISHGHVHGPDGQEEG